MLTHTTSWDAVVACLEAFVGEWATGTAPRIEDFLPAGPPPVRERVLVELVKADIDERLRAGCPLPLEHYGTAHPELGDAAGPPVEVIHEEYRLRRGRGDPVSVDDLCRRFPGRAAEIRRWCQPLAGAVTVTGGLSAAARLPRLAAGDTIDDFLLVASLGRGAFATVWLARQVSMGRMVALKVSADRGEEAWTLAQLDHPHIVRVYDQRRLPERELRLIYEQFLAGGTLAAVVQRVRETPPSRRSAGLIVESVRAAAAAVGLETADPPPGRLRTWPDAVAAVGIDLAGALDHAHAAGVLHRDVKPANVLLGTDCAPRLADFNTSWLASHPAAGAAASFGGSLAYMAPEHLEAFHARHDRTPEELDGRADLYSLAVLLWELLTGTRPFRDDVAADIELDVAIADLIARRRAEAFERDDLPDDAASRPLLAVLRDCLAADRDRRPATGAELARRLVVCREPRAAALLAVDPGGWRAVALRHPFLAVAAAVLVPNLILGVFNYLYNHRLLIEIHATPQRLPLLPAVDAAFQRTALVVNAVAFPLGLWFAWLFTRPIVAGMRPADRGGATAAAARRATLRLGDVAAWIGVGEWLLAGLAFPLGIWLQTGWLAAEVPWLFMQSPVACGLLAAAYPFFLSSVLAVRVFYPAQLVASGSVGAAAADEPALRGLVLRSGVMLLVAGGVPLVTLGLLIMVHQSSDRLALSLVTAAGLLGLAFASWARHLIQADTDALVAVGRPIERHPTRDGAT